MPTTVLLRRNAASAIKQITSQEPLLPFLYNTRTIRNQHTDALSEFENSSNERESKPRSRNSDRPSFRSRSDRYNNEEQERPRRFERRERMGNDFDGPSEQSGSEYRRPAREEHIPFEHAAQETMSIRDKISTSTMTPLEKKAFENLLSLSPQKAPRDKGRHRDRIEDVLKEAAKSRAKQAARDEPMPEALKEMQDKMKDDRSVAQKALLEQAVELDLQQVKKAFETAETDVELWKMLHERVLSRVTKLRLEEPAPARPMNNRKSRAERNTTPKWTGDVSDELVITRTLPQHLAECQRQLFTTFPSSELHLSLLPYLKSLGPTTFALATSTKLYNQHMRSLIKQGNLSQIVHTLQEMDKEVYEFDDKTKDLLEAMKKRGYLIRGGANGEGLRALAGGERYQKAMRSAMFWSYKIENRLQEQALREAKLKEEDVAL